MGVKDHPAPIARKNSPPPSSASLIHAGQAGAVIPVIPTSGGCGSTTRLT